MQVLFATEHDGLLTLDFILSRDLAMPGGELALAGQPFALTFAMDPDGSTVAVRRRLREWCERSVLVVARPRDDGERHGLVMCHEDEVVELAFH